MTIVLQEFFGSQHTRASCVDYALDVTRYLDARHGPWLRTAILLVAVAGEPLRPVASRFGVPQLWLQGYVDNFKRELLA